MGKEEFVLLRRIGFVIALAGLLCSGAGVSASEGKILQPLTVDKHVADRLGPRVILSGFNSMPSPRNILKLERDNPWALPKVRTAAAKIDTLRVLVLRFDFVKEVPDDPFTTGDGTFNLEDTLAFQQKYGHMIDPSPHDAKYFSTHLQALRDYYFFVSDGKLEMTWDVYPPEDSACYHLPHSTGHYGSQPPGFGLTEYFIDCIQLADTAGTEIVFRNYDSYFLFHAGSDRQNDLSGIQNTPSDLFTGYITLLDTALYVDKKPTDSTAIIDGLIMPETACQDNRATALNAVLAHEFGHQLGLVDLYRTDNFFTRVGDFSLMDDNGFGTAIDFGFEVGRAYGVSPVYPDAWSRVFLGFVEPVVFHKGTSIELAAAEMQSLGIKVARIPISEYEYYLLENRQEDIDGLETVIIADPVTSVIKGPGRRIDKQLTGEYDFILPGSGMLIWHVDEIVAFMDYNGNGRINFFDNQVQNDPNRPFIEVMEADGLVNFGGNYYSGYGKQEDMYYEGNNSSLTPNTNPAAIGWAGNNSHIYITNISGSGLNMTFDVDYDFLSAGFPQRAGVPLYGLSPVAADINNDGSTEIIAASKGNLLVLNEDGSDFTPSYGPSYYDTSYILNNHNMYPIYPVPLFAKPSGVITAGPVVGKFDSSDDSQYIAVASGQWLHVYDIKDSDLDGLADHLFASLSILGWEIVWMSFGGGLSVAVMDTSSDLIRLYNISKDPIAVDASRIINENELFGVAKIDSNFALIAGDTTSINLYYITDNTSAGLHKYELNGRYTYGPVAVDLDRDSLIEIVVATPDGDVKVVTVDPSGIEPVKLYGSVSLGGPIYANPVVSDIDEDGYADIIFGGKNKIYALDRNLVSLMNFPLLIDRRFTEDFVVSSPVIGDLNHDGIKDIVVATSAGNYYAFSTDYSTNNELLYGFPISSGSLAMGSPLIYGKSNGGGLAFLGKDGWFYSYDIAYDSVRTDWPMGGGGPEGAYFYPESRLGSVKTYADNLPEDKFFCYPNPSPDGRMTIRYFVGDDARIKMTIYDMSGKKVSGVYSLSGAKGTYNEMPWDGSNLATGVYRCVIEADFKGGESKTAFTDIAIIK